MRLLAIALLAAALSAEDGPAAQLESLRKQAWSLKPDQALLERVRDLAGRVPEGRERLEGLLLLAELQHKAGKGGDADRTLDAILGTAELPGDLRISCLTMRGKALERAKRVRASVPLLADIAGAAEAMAAAKQPFPWSVPNDLRWAAARAEQAGEQPLAERLLGIVIAGGDAGAAAGADGDLAGLRWRQGRRDEAEAIWKRLAESPERSARTARLEHAQAVRGLDRARGDELLAAALADERIDAWRRNNVLGEVARQAAEDGDEAGATRWWQLAIAAPGFGKDAAKSASRGRAGLAGLAWNRGDRAAAQALWEQVLNDRQGDPEARIRARDGLDLLALTAQVGLR